MSRRMRILRNVGIGLAAFLVLVVGATVVTLRTEWFRNFLKEKIISATEEATGGKVDIGSLAIQWVPLRAVVTDFVIHGSEPANAPPFVRLGRIQVDVRLFPKLNKIYALQYLGLERPEVNVMIFPDGRNNVPQPKRKSTSNSNSLDTVVDLAVDRFELTRGLLRFNSAQQPLDVRGENLLAQLRFDATRERYSGQVSLEPLYIVNGRNTPVRFAITLPVSLDRNQIVLQNAQIATAASKLLIDASVADLRDPKVAARVQGRVALADLRNAGSLPLRLDAPNVPAAVEVAVNATSSKQSIEIGSFRIAAGRSVITAFGPLRDPNGRGALRYQVELALDELGRLAGSEARPEGVALLSGTAKLDSSNQYDVSGKLQTKNVSFQQGSRRIRDIALVSAVHLDPNRLTIRGFRLDAFGGELAAEATLEQFSRYRVKSELRHFDLRTAAVTFGQQNFPYSGVISGPIEAEGNLKAPGASSITARARLAIAPGSRGIPLSGRLHGDYNGSTKDILITDSFIAMPHSRLTLAGSLGHTLNVALATTDLHDLAAAASPATIPVALNGGRATLAATVIGDLSSPRVTGNLTANRLSVQGRQFDEIRTDFAAAASGASVSNGSLTRGTMQTRFAASVGLRNWKTSPRQRVSAEASVRNGDLADFMVLAGQPGEGYSGAVTADAHVGGTLGNPSGTVSLNVGKGTIREEPFDEIRADVQMTDQRIAIPAAYIASESERVNLAAEFEHPKNSFDAGRLHARLQSTPIDLARLRTLRQQRPDTAGVLQINADATASLAGKKNGGKTTSEFLLTGISLDASARGLRFDGQQYGDLTATARTRGDAVSYNVKSNFAGSGIRVEGSTRLLAGYPTDAQANIDGLPIERVLMLARSEVPARGRLSARARFTGTMERPEGELSLDLASAVVYDEPIDHIHARAAYRSQSLELSQLEIASGPSRIGLRGRYEHPAGNLQSGRLQLQVVSSPIDLGRIRNVQKARPGLGGALQINADASAAVRQGQPRILLSNLSANIAATEIAVEGRNFGDLKLIAKTSGGRLNFNLDSNLAKASIHGKGDAGLSGDYPLNAELTFQDVAWTRLQGLIGRETARPSDFEAVVDGRATLNGPVTKSANLQGQLQVTRLHFNTIPTTPAGKPVTIENQGPIVATLNRGAVRLQNLHLVGPDADIQAGGTASLTTRSLDLSLKANTNLGLLRDFNRDIYSGGALVLATTVRGTMDKPLINGRLELQNGTFSYTDIPAGISKANGLIMFNGNSASIRNLTAESGGGTVRVSGFVGFGEVLRFAVRTNVESVRIRPNSGVSVVAGANMSLTGTAQSSLVSGNIEIQQINYAPQTDFGSILSGAGPPVKSAEAPSPLLDNMKLDIRVRTSSSVEIQAAVAQNLQADADLRVQGTASRPSLLGRVSITEGQLVFFGSTYTVNSGTISFFNPVRIEPVLNVSLETQAKGVEVVLTVTGPIDNMNLSYTSDPPLQFQEIVSLLASGKTPTSDPTILANQPSQPQQSFQQMGESALVSKAIAEPVASQLKRVFGVSQLKIDPTFTSGSELPQARLTLQQQISSNVTFTYVTALDDPNTQIIRAEWAFNQRWSAAATRDENGILSINFYYKKQLH